MPPEHAGKSVFIGHLDHRIVIRAEDMIVAVHMPGRKTGDTVAEPVHIEALWKLSLNHAQAPVPRWQLTFDQQVAANSLASYQEAMQ